MPMNCILFSWNERSDVFLGFGALTGQTKNGALDAYSQLVDSSFIYREYDNYVDFYIPAGVYQIGLGPYSADVGDPDGNGYFDVMIDTETTIGKLNGSDKCYRLVATVALEEYQETYADVYSIDTNLSTLEVTNEEPSAFTEVEVCLSNKENPGVMFVESSDETGIWYLIESETDDSLDEDEWTSNY